jgi:hypothetical protein
MKYFGYFEKYEFNPKTNNMDSEIVALSTKVNYKNCKEFRQYFWIALIKYFIAALITGGLCLFLGLTSTDLEKEKAGIVLSIVFPSSAILFGLANSIFGWSFEFDKSELIDWFRWNEPAYVDLQMHNHKEFERRDEWRENHPFEEKVRKALESKNGNDVADVIKMIMEKETM